MDQLLIKEFLPVRSSQRVPLRIEAMGRRGRGVVANRRIEPGEELPIDYQMTLWFDPE